MSKALSFTLFATFIILTSFSFFASLFAHTSTHSTAVHVLGADGDRILPLTGTVHPLTETVRSLTPTTAPTATVEPPTGTAVPTGLPFTPTPPQPDLLVLQAMPCPYEAQAYAIVSTFAQLDAAVSCANAFMTTRVAQPFAIYLAEGKGVLTFTHTLHIQGGVQVSISGRGQEESVFDGGGSVRLFDVAGTLELHHVTIRNGRAQGAYGGGMRVAGQVSILDSVLSNNTAQYGGGGIYISTGSVRLSRSTLRANTAGGGGAIQVSGLYNPPGASMQIKCGRFENNGGYGALLQAEQAGLSRIRYSAFVGGVMAEIYTLTNVEVDARENWWNGRQPSSVVGPSGTSAIQTGGALSSDPTQGEGQRAACISPLPMALPTTSPPTATPTPTPTATPTATSTLTAVPSATPIPTDADCEKISSGNPDYSLLTVSNTDTKLREACLRLYESIIFLVIYHELSQDTINFLDLSQLDQLNDIPYQSLTTFIARPDSSKGYSAINSSETALFSEYSGNIRYAFARAIINLIIDGYAARNQNPMRAFARNFSKTVDNNWTQITPFCGENPWKLLR